MAVCWLNHTKVCMLLVYKYFYFDVYYNAMSLKLLIAQLNEAGLYGVSSFLSDQMVFLLISFFSSDYIIFLDVLIFQSKRYW